jgi:hypothetical protein
MKCYYRADGEGWREGDIDVSDGATVTSFTMKIDLGGWTVTHRLRNAQMTTSSKSLYFTGYHEVERVTKAEKLAGTEKNFRLVTVEVRFQKPREKKDARAG